MQCPLFRAGELSKGSWMRENLIGCLKEECAFWNKEYQRCDVTGLLSPIKELITILKASSKQD